MPRRPKKMARPSRPGTRRRKSSAAAKRAVTVKRKPAHLQARRDAKYFEVFYGSDLSGRPEAQQDMVFRAVAAALHKMPHEALVLKAKIEDTLNRVTSVVKGAEKQAPLLEQIGGYARIGLEEGQFELATTGITAFQEEFARTVGLTLRADYIKSMAVLGGLIGGPALLLAMFGELTLGHFVDQTDLGNEIMKTNIQLAKSGLFIIIGLCIGAVLSAFIRNRQINFANVGYFDQDSLDPKLRYLFLGILAAALAILLYKKWIIVGVTTSMTLNDFNTDAMTAVVLGLVTGYAEPNVTKMVTGGLEAAKPRSASA
jgi:hypothetical protein